MLEIIALIYLCRKMAALAERKGLNRSTWKLYTVLAWFGAEILGVFVSLILFNLSPGDMIAAFPLAYGFAIGSYFLLKASLSKRPDAVQSSFEFEQQPVEQIEE